MRVHSECCWISHSTGGGGPSVLLPCVGAHVSRRTHTSRAGVHRTAGGHHGLGTTRVERLSVEGSRVRGRAHEGTRRDGRLRERVAPARLQRAVVVAWLVGVCGTRVF